MKSACISFQLQFSPSAAPDLHFLPESSSGQRACEFRILVYCVANRSCFWRTMAMATASTSKTYQPLKRQSARSAVAVRGRSQQVEQPMVATEQTRPSSSSRYAILELGGVRQMVEEGQQYACLSRYLQDAKQSSASNNAVFHSVLGLRSDGVFQWGKPFVPDAAVEVEVLEEFQGPIPHSTNSVLVDTVMARYRVKHIRSSYATQQLSQQR